MQSGQFVFEEGEAASLSVDHVRLVSGGTVHPRGTLTVTNRRVWFRAEDGEDTGALSVAFRRISMHAVAREKGEDGFDRPCIYCHLESDDPDEVVEVWFMPQQEAQLDDMFKAFCDGAAANPDPVEDDDGQDDGFVVAENGLRDQNAAHWDRAFVEPDGRFDDPDEDEDGDGDVVM